LDNRAYKEKRDFMRLTVDAPIYLMLDTARAPLEGICKNISNTGMLIELSESLPIKTQCAVLIHTARTDRPPLEAIIEIVRQTKSKQGTFLVGAKIKQMT
jgi:hypothetical protein